MSDLAPGWTTPSRFCGIQGVTSTPHHTPGISRGASPKAEPQTAPFLPMPTPPSPRSSSSQALQSFVAVNGFGQMRMNLSWPSPCDSEIPITHLSKWMPSPVPLSHLNLITSLDFTPALTHSPLPWAPHHHLEPWGWGTGTWTSGLAHEEKGTSVCWSQVYL